MVVKGKSGLFQSKTDDLFVGINSKCMLVVVIVVTRAKLVGPGPTRPTPGYATDSRFPQVWNHPSSVVPTEFIA